MPCPRLCVGMRIQLACRGMPTQSRGHGTQRRSRFLCHPETLELSGFRCFLLDFYNRPPATTVESRLDEMRNLLKRMISRVKIVNGVARRRFCNTPALIARKRAAGFIPRRKKGEKEKRGQEGKKGTGAYSGVSGWICDRRQCSSLCRPIRGRPRERRVDSNPSLSAMRSVHSSPP